MFGEKKKKKTAETKRQNGFKVKLDIGLKKWTVSYENITPFYK